MFLLKTLKTHVSSTELTRDHIYTHTRAHTHILSLSLSLSPPCPLSLTCSFIHVHTRHIWMTAYRVCLVLCFSPLQLSLFHTGTQAHTNGTHRRHTQRHTQTAHTDRTNRPHTNDTQRRHTHTSARTDTFGIDALLNRVKLEVIPLPCGCLPSMWY